MKNIPQIICFALKYHLNFSHSTAELIEKPLKKYLQIKFAEWDGENLILNKSILNSSAPIIFHQLPPPANILSIQNRRLIWIPMWDHIYSYPAAFWQSLPKNVRIVAFSEAVAKLSQNAGLPTLRLKFFFKSQKMDKSDNGNVLYYWNRTGLFDKKFLEKISKSLQIKKIIFQSQLDPGIPKSHYYSLPDNLANAKIEKVNSYLSAKVYSKIKSLANIYLAPRVREGVGLSYLQAMANGCIVFAANAPAMNEYIIHKQNGFLFNSKSPLTQFINRLSGKKEDLYYSSNLSEYQNWREIAGLDLKKMEQNALKINSQGYKQWLNKIPDLADFILN